MRIRAPFSAVASVMAFLRRRVGSVGEVTYVSGSGPSTVLVGAAAPFAPTSPARVRLLRQAYASGLLDARYKQRVRALEAGSSAYRVDRSE